MKFCIAGRVNDIKKKNDATIVSISEGSIICEVHFFREKGKRADVENMMDLENKENKNGKNSKISKTSKFDFTLIPPKLSICPLWTMNLKINEYVKIFGTQRSHFGKMILKGKFIKRIEDYNEYTNYLLKVMREHSVRIQGEISRKHK